MRRRTSDSRRPRSGPAAREERAPTRPARTSSSCRWSPTRAPSRARAAPPARRPRRGRSSPGACPGASCRRRLRPACDSRPTPRARATSSSRRTRPSLWRATGSASAESLCTSVSMLYSDCHGPPARLPGDLAGRPQGARGVPGRDPQALLRRGHPRPAQVLRGATRPLADDARVLGGRGDDDPPADRDRAVRELEPRQARGRPRAATLRDEGGAAAAACASWGRGSAARRPRRTSTRTAGSSRPSPCTGTRSAR